MKPATKGPWKTIGHPLTGDCIYVGEAHYPETMTVLFREAYHDDEGVDLAFVLAARTAVPQLIEEVERLEKGIEYLTQAFTESADREVGLHEKIEFLRGRQSSFDAVTLTNHEIALKENTALKLERDSWEREAKINEDALKEAQAGIPQCACGRISPHGNVCSVCLKAEVEKLRPKPIQQDRGNCATINPIDLDIVLLEEVHPNAFQQENQALRELLGEALRFVKCHDIPSLPPHPACTCDECTLVKRIDAALGEPNG